MHRRGFGPFSDEILKSIENWESQFDAQIAGLEAMQVELRRHLHAHPEPSGEEVETSRFIAGQLAEAGLEPQICRAGLGVVADVTVGNPPAGAPLVAVRSDIDALRLFDEKHVDYASQNPGIAHACGHDAHATIVLGTALAAARVNGAIRGGDHSSGARLRCLFQPAEETSQGAVWLVEQGVLEGVDAILGLHVDPERPVGQVGIRYGVLTAHCDEVEIVVEGHGGHAARPHHTVDPVAAAAHLVSTLYEFLPRAIDSRNPSVFTVGRISGGYAPNVIPERVELGGSLRTTDLESQETLKRRVSEICQATETNSGAQVRVRFHSPLKAVVNHPRIAAALEEASRRVVGPENVKLIDRPSMGGEDFAVYLDYVPGALVRLGCAEPGTKAPFLHSSRFDIDERALALGTRIVVRAALMLSIGARSLRKE